MGVPPKLNLLFNFRLYPLFPKSSNYRVSLFNILHYLVSWSIFLGDIGRNGG